MMARSNKRWSIKAQEEFLIRVGDLYSNGYSLLEAIELMSIYYEDKKKSNDLLRAIQELKNGFSIHKVLEMLDFHQDVLSLLFFSQKHGNLGDAFKTAGQLMQRKRYYHQKLMEIIRYPIFLLFLVLIMLIFVQTVLLPQFNQLFQQMNIALHKGITMFFIVISKLPQLLFFTAILIGCLLLLTRIYAKRIHPTKKLKLLMKIPLLKSFLSLHYSHYFSQQLSSLLSSGMTINEAISVFEQQTYHAYFQVRAAEFRERLIEGEKFEQLIQRDMVFEKGLASVILHGQKNGRLSRELEEYSRLLLANLQKKSESLLGKIQPCLFLAIGAFVLVLYLCIFIPMFQLLGGL
ncbi:competence type IV pilus assembly protein ComGB [Sutcliffiella halmapala]|uniref:competence type IV pilus assembly protein ComGB n=1 Tax=Sutcliffiella halmapala TaxID=79882 RepID=UPI001472EEDA|nr:competence type IV pilus assembly protein ComGB [Sutcliffiella halmapala]